MHFRKFHNLAHSFWQSAAKAIFLLFYRITIEIHIQHLHKKSYPAKCQSFRFESF
ncbi:hypothetical protein EDO6_03824 [Paenibacillus xylanexedens]|nr:hypothetical protein EDO6_03824 [Paenibacillus xylanexedens]